MQNKELELAYVAGIIDGEGTIQLDLPSQFMTRRYALRVQVAVQMVNMPKDRNVPLMLHEQFGGMITTHIKNKNRRETIRWTIRAKEAVEFLKLMLPYLVIKRGQALIVIKYQQIKLSLDKDNHLDFKEMMHVLNRTGTA